MRRRSATSSARAWCSTSSSPTRSSGRSRSSLDPRSFTIATFALCGFANLSSIGIQIGGIGALAPNRRHDLARLGLRAMFAGHARQLHDGDDRRLPAVTYFDRVSAAAARGAARRAPVLPETAVVLGSGLGDFAGTLERSGVAAVSGAAALACVARDRPRRPPGRRPREGQDDRRPCGPLPRATRATTRRP